jgi:flavin reductase (DIM6/NTAB) family NADH-FMN oxidoreductase RutF/rubredoxin
MNEKAMYKLTYGLFVLTTKDGNKDNGCIINTAGQVTTTPNRISIAVNKANYTHDMILSSKKFNVSILSEAADFEVFKRFGFQSGKDVDKFEGFAGAKRSENGIYYVTEGTNGYISGTVEQTIDLGTHTLFIATVEDMEILSDVPSTTYSYYQSNIKPKPVKTGVTEEGKTIWRCVICGYEYVGEELPEDFICPICKHPASDFEKVTK